jgi:Transcriptional regulators
MLKGIAHYERSHRPWATFFDDEARAEVDPHWLRSKKWHGVISRHTSPSLVQGCAELGLPLVDLHDAPPYPGVPKIRPDNIAMGHLGAEHLLERGFRHFGFCGFADAGWSNERRDGFLEALRLAGHPCDVFDVDDPIDLTPFWDANQTAALSAWLKRLSKPAAVMASNDMRAQQVASAAHAAGLLVPEEVAILGANNDPIRCELAEPPLSSVATNAFQSGYQAAEQLAQMMAGERVDVFDRRIEPIGVVTRQSTDILAVGDKNVAAAVSYIREHACHGITVDDVLKQAFASRSQLEKKFRRFIGRSPQAEIRRVQVGRIRQLLFETDFPLKKIAELAGFEHVEYMCVVFKRLTGDSPGSYRKKVQSKVGHHR